MMRVRLWGMPGAQMSQRGYLFSVYVGSNAWSGVSQAVYAYAHVSVYYKRESPKLQRNVCLYDDERERKKDKERERARESIYLHERELQQWAHTPSCCCSLCGGVWGGVRVAVFQESPADVIFLCDITHSGSRRSPIIIRKCPAAEHMAVKEPLALHRATIMEDRAKSQSEWSHQL